MTPPEDIPAIARATVEAASNRLRALADDPSVTYCFWLLTRVTHAARYVRADDLERGLWREVRRVLANPAVVLHELARERQPEIDPAELSSIEKALASVKDRERPLVKLYSFGEVDEEFLRGELTGIRRERAHLEQRRRAVRPSPASQPRGVDQRLVTRACREVER